KIKTDNEILHDPEEISNAFARYFSNIFAPSETNKYDNNFKCYVENKVKSFADEQGVSCDDRSCPVEFCELSKVVKNLKRRKSPGPDKVTNEHIINGGSALLQKLKILYDKMFQVEYVSEVFKLGTIIPVHKPGKCHEALQSYRPITLISTLYKIFESVLHTRLTNWSVEHDKKFPNLQQNAYQKHLGSLTVSFNLQETVAHNAELGSNSYSAFLDATKAFDNVWHEGLFLKLSEFGIKGKALNLIKASYTDMSSYILVNGVKSSTFPIKQGVRQGGVTCTSTWYFLLFIDGLLNELQRSRNGSNIGSLEVGNPTLADDLVIISPNANSLEKALKIVYDYSIKWRFSFNSEKCHLLIFSQKRQTINASVKFGPAQLKQKEAVTHVGIELNKSLKSSNAVQARIQKGRASLFSILDIDRNTGLVSPSVLASILEKVCFPTVLYGAELWHTMTSLDYNKLEKFIRLAAKSVQKFPLRTRTDIALGMLGWLPMRARVEQRKLIFLQKLCTMPPDTLARQVFDLRLNLFLLKGCRNQLGFIPDVWDIVLKYDLSEYLHQYTLSSAFPSKYQWKKLIVRRITDFYATQWSERLESDHEFSRFKTLHPKLEMSVIWKDTSAEPGTFLVARLWHDPG
ncbi:MAG: reverse transcriptase family protein, partial [Candidatus Thiodiazotropha taylori]|nr:reverse transcriptase family protein [Candidatus Thiodiazotropha taylori]MCW4336871.1 reverse transcriptase family protein [Candidatus Thiodiazotropha endolucinida]